MPQPHQKKSNKKKKGGKGGGGGGQGTSSASSIERLIEEGQEHLAHERYDEGMKSLKKAATLAPGSSEAAEAYGIALAEFGDPDEAIVQLKRAASLRPNEGYEKFMYLGQLLDDGVAATTCTRQGLAIIELQAAAGDEEAEERMSQACCALAEQILGTAEDPDEVNSECEALLKRAMELEPTSAEPLQVMASLRSEQGRKDEALEALRQSIAMWRGKAGKSTDDDEDDEEDDDFDEYPVSFEFRFETAKLLLELDEKTDMAIEVLEELLAERDEVVDVWHLLALANHGCCQFDKAIEYLDTADELLDRQGGDEGKASDIMELRAAVDESKEKWNEDVGADHRMDED